jgi:hypothetical protein
MLAVNSGEPRNAEFSAQSFPQQNLACNLLILHQTPGFSTYAGDAPGIHPPVAPV